MDGTAPENKIANTPPAPGGAIPAPGAAIPAPGAAVPNTSVPAPGSSIPTPGAAIPAPGSAVPAPGTSVPIPGAAVPGSAIPAPGAVAPGAAIPVPGASIPTPGSAIPAPGTAVPAPGAVAPGSAIPAPGAAAPGAAIPVPGAAAPGMAVPAPGAVAPGAVAPGAVPVPGAVAPAATPATKSAPNIPDAEKRQRTDHSGNAKKDVPLRIRLARPITRKQWILTLGAGLVGIVILAAIVVGLTRLLLGTDTMQDFITTYPGKYEKSSSLEEGFPAWLSWQHFLNMFFMILIIRTGIQINQTRRPKGYWTPKKGGKKISLTLWTHLSLDLLWIINGAVFFIMLFATGQWMRIVPTSWEVFPNALSAGLQYLSLDWPTESSWASYNSLQELTYFLTVFIAAPLSIISGWRMSSYWPKNNAALNKILPIGFARAIHLPVMVYYVVFICIHVFLVLATGALRNLNHMYAGQDVENWVGFGWFVASLIVIIAGFFAIRPVIIAPIAKLFGQVTAR